MGNRLGATVRRWATALLVAGLCVGGSARSDVIPLLQFGFQNRASFGTSYFVQCADQDGNNCLPPGAGGDVQPLRLDVSTTGQARVTGTNIPQGDQNYFFTGTSNTLAGFDSYAQTDLTGSRVKRNRLYASISQSVAAPWQVTVPDPADSSLLDTFDGSPRAFTQARSTWADDLLFVGPHMGSPGQATIHFTLSGNAVPGADYIFQVCKDVVGPLNLNTSSTCFGTSTARTIGFKVMFAAGGAFSDNFDVTLDFTYGMPLRLDVGLNPALENLVGINDMFNSADLVSMTVPEGTTVLDGTGTGFNLQFEQPASASAPGSLTLVLAGLLRLCVCRRRLPVRHAGGSRDRRLKNTRPGPKHMDVAL